MRFPGNTDIFSGLTGPIGREATGEEGARVCSATKKLLNLLEGSDGRKMKPRTVLLGDDVLGDRTLDVRNLQLGHAQSVSDAESAYLQSWLNSEHPTYVHPPREVWSAEWEGK